MARTVGLAIGNSQLNHQNEDGNGGGGNGSGVNINNMSLGMNENLVQLAAPVEQAQSQQPQNQGLVSLPTPNGTNLNTYGGARAETRSNGNGNTTTNESILNRYPMNLNFELSLRDGNGLNTNYAASTPQGTSIATAQTDATSSYQSMFHYTIAIIIII